MAVSCCGDNNGADAHSSVALSSVAHSLERHALHCFCTKQLLNLFRLNFPVDNEQYCVRSCEPKPKEPAAERKASCVARSELRFQASCQDSCTRLEDLQPQPWGASEERLMYGYPRLTWEKKQEEAQTGTERRPLLYIRAAALWSTGKLWFPHRSQSIVQHNCLYCL